MVRVGGTLSVIIKENEIMINWVITLFKAIRVRGGGWSLSNLVAWVIAISIFMIVGATLIIAAGMVIIRLVDGEMLNSLEWSRDQLLLFILIVTVWLK
jgi:hypothetical protein